MPHLTVEYTANLGSTPPTPELFLNLHALLNTVAGIRPENCKSRWREVEEWVVGFGDTSSAFVHLDLRFLEGRPLDVQQAVGEGALEILKAHFLPEPPGLELQITVEVQEIRKATYFKFPPGTLGGPAVRLV
ncbi:MAG: 5-carboxymethyl-2-hydroxymuconate Delta-isomerase [Longimicrobiales bacterium]